MTNEPREDLFTSKMQKVRNVLTVGEGFVDVEVVYERAVAMVFFRAPGALSFKMRRDEFDAKSDCEIAFFAATKMRRPPVVVAKPAAAGKPAAKPVT